MHLGKLTFSGYTWTSYVFNLVWVTKFSFVSKALIIIHRKKRQKSENWFTHKASALVVTNTIWPASFFLTLAYVSWKSDKKHHSLDEVQFLFQNKHYLNFRLIKLCIIDGIQRIQCSNPVLKTTWRWVKVCTYDAKKVIN